MKTNITFLFLFLSISVFAQNSAELLAKYTFENNLVNELNASVSGEALAQPSGTVPVFELNEERGGTVMHLYFGFDGAQSISYIKFINPLKEVDTEGATVSLWINRLDPNNPWDAIWSFFDDDNSDGIDGRAYLTPNAYFGFNGTGGWFDCNHPEDAPNSVIPANAWSMVTVTVSTTGFEIYVNDEKISDQTTQLGWRSLDNIAAADFNYSHVINLLKSSANFYLGYGSWWGSSPILVDDLSIYEGVLTAAEIAALYNTTGIKNPVSNLEISLFYDKQANTITINGLTGNEKVDLVNLIGQPIGSVNHSIIHTKNLNKGVYLLRINRGSISEVKKIMIQ
jgi:arabinan endo-1,5-alpha-L-arabinosidase